MPQESPHFEHGLTSSSFEASKVPYWAWRDPFLDNSEPRTRASGLGMRESSQRSADLRLHFGPRKNEGIAEGRDAPTLLDLVEEPFDQVPRTIQIRAEADRVFAISFRRNVRPCPLLAGKLPDPVRVVSTIRE